MAKYLTLQNTDDTSVTSGDIVGQLGFAASNDSSASNAIVISAAVIASADGTFDASNNPGSLVFATSPTGPATGQIKIVDSGHLEPIGNKIKNLGSSSSRWANLYVTGIVFNDNTLQNTAFTGGGGGGTPGGSTTQFQYNNAGSFNGTSGVIYEATGGTGTLFKVHGTGSTTEKLFTIDYTGVTTPTVVSIYRNNVSDTDNLFQVLTESTGELFTVDYTGNVSGKAYSFGDGTTQTSAFELAHTFATSDTDIYPTVGGWYEQNPNLLTATRLFVLPSGTTDGDMIGITLNNNGFDYEYKIVPATGAEIRVEATTYSDGAEFTRLFIRGESMVFRAIGNGVWSVFIDGRIACDCKAYQSSNITNHYANGVYTRVPVNTNVKNVGYLMSLANEWFQVRRRGTYLFGYGIEATVIGGSTNVAFRTVTPSGNAQSQNVKRTQFANTTVLWTDTVLSPQEAVYGDLFYVEVLHSAGSAGDANADDTFISIKELL
jgi:hypothetical protein